MKTYNIKEKIKKHFFMNPTKKMRVRQIEREIKLPLPSVIRYCKELEKEGILKKETISGVSTYSADRTSKKFLMLLISTMSASTRSRTVMNIQ